MEQTQVEHPRVYFNTHEILLSKPLGLSVSAHILRIEKLVVLHGVDSVLASVELAMRSVTLSKEREMCLLAALQYIASVYQSDRELQYTHQLQNLFSTKRLSLTVEAFSMSVVKFVYAGRADLAVEQLIKHFRWLRAHRVQDAAGLNIAAAYVCNKFGQFDLAVQFSYLGYSSAFHAGDEFSISYANFFVLSANHLSGCSSVSLQSMYNKEIVKLEAGQLDLGVHANYLLPVYAASQEVTSASPDLSRAAYLLELATDLENATDGNCRAAWAAVNGFLQLCQGHDRTATALLKNSEQWQERAEATIDPLRNLLQKGLGLQTSSPNLTWKPATARAWQELRYCADHQSTSVSA